MVFLSTSPKRGFAKYNFRLFPKIAASVFSAAIIGISFNAIAFNERGALWHVVHDVCLPVHQAISLPFPCLKVDAQQGFVVIRAPQDKTQILIVPTIRLAGIESPEILQDGMPNLWEFAWNERNLVATKAQRPLDWGDIGLAINSQGNRTQDQLHIHVDCVDARLKRVLASQAEHISEKWSALNLEPWAGRYLIKSIGVAGLRQNIFKIIAREVPGAQSHMGLQTIAIAGYPGKDGEQDVALLVNSANGHAEELLDHSCAQRG